MSAGDFQTCVDTRGAVVAADVTAARCPDCGGRGRMRLRAGVRGASTAIDPCPRCEGLGVIPVAVVFDAV